MKKVLSVILAVVMLASIFTALPVMASALDASGSCGTNVNYTFDSSNGKLTISGTGAMGKYFPATTPFAYATDVKTIVIENGVTDIGQYMFYHCENVTSVTIPASVTEIKYDAFDSCKSLKNIIIPNGVVTIGGQAFCDCEALESISIPKSVTTVGDRAFLACENLKDVYYAGTQSDWNNISISDDNNDYFTSATLHLETMGACGANLTYFINDETKTLTISGTGDMYDYTAMNRSPFYQNTKIERIVIKDGATSIGDNAFSLCAKLKSVRIPYTVKKIGMAAFSYCYALENAEIPQGVSAIRVSTFYYCKTLASVAIPDSVVTIGDSAFTNCSNLGTIYYSGTAYQWAATPKGNFNDRLQEAGLQTRVFTGNCGDAAYFHFFEADGSLSLHGTGATDNYPVEYPEYYVYRDDIKEIYVSDLTTIGQAAFYDLPNATYACLSSSVKVIDNAAFAKCTSLEYVEMPEKLDRLADSAFLECKSLEEIYIPEGVTQIEEYTFASCEKLADVEIPSTVKTIGKEAFNNCPSLENLVIPEGVYEIKDYAFKFCKGLKHITLPWSLVLLGKDVFNGASDDFTVTASCVQNAVNKIIEGTNRKWNKVHVWGDPSVVKPTATKLGYTERICADCGDSIKSDFKAPTGKPSGVKCIARTAAAEKITWNKVAGVTGYQAQILNSAGKSVELKTTTANTYVFQKLAAGHGYKVRVRFYIKADDGKNYFSQWTTINSPTLPKATKLTSVAGASKAFTAKWSKQAGVTGYQIQYATNSKFTGGKAKAVKGAAKYSMKVTALKAKTTYYVRVRTFKTIGGTNYFSTWSAVKAVKTK